MKHKKDLKEHKQWWSTDGTKTPVRINGTIQMITSMLIFLKVLMHKKHFTTWKQELEYSCFQQKGYYLQTS